MENTLDEQVARIPAYAVEDSAGPDMQNESENDDLEEVTFENDEDAEMDESDEETDEVTDEEEEA